MKRITVVVLLLLSCLVMGRYAPAQDPLPDKEKKWKLDELAKLVPKLVSNDSLERAKAIEGARRVGLPEAIEPLLKAAVEEPYAFLARLAAESAVGLDRAAAFKKAKELVKKHGSGSSLAKRNLVIILGEIGGEDGGKVLLDEFSDSANKETLVELLFAVGKLKLPAGIGIIKQGLGSQDMDLRNIAALAAARHGSPEFIPALLGALDTADEEHAKFAAYALSRIDDAGIFPQVQARLGSASGIVGEAKAKALEGCARPEHVDKLIAILSSSRSREYREAAAVALGRVGHRNKEAQEALFARMLRDPERTVRGCCWHALSRIATPDIAPLVLKRQSQKDPEKAKYVFHLIGDLRLAAGARTLMKVMINERKDVMLRYAAAINFWKAADSKTIAALEERIEASQGVFLERGLQALGFRRNEEGFRFAVRMLQVLEGKKEVYFVEKALERMTGHFFGPYKGIWDKWFKKNPDFFTPKQFELERNKWRKDFDKENKGFRQTEETERAVQLGLEYLARHQSLNGAFSCQDMFNHCEPDQPCSKSTGTRVQLDPSGTSALVILAFQGAGYMLDGGKYKEVIHRALEYLMARQQANGNYKTNDLIGGYNRPLGAQAFAEASILTGDKELGWYAQKSIDFLTTIQNRLGGWRYRVVIQTTDTSVMSWNLFALKTGARAGLDVKEIAIAGCYNVMDLYSSEVTEHREDFIDIDPAYGYEVGRDTTYTYETGYQNRVWDTKYATVPLGIMCRIFMGWRRSHPFCIGSANKILQDMMEEIPKNEDWSKYVSRREYPTYAWYYGTLAMHQMGGRYFREWNERIRKLVPGTQEKEGCSRGSWPTWNHDIFGRLYTTSMGVLTLETYYRYLPVLQD